MGTDGQGGGGSVSRTDRDSGNKTNYNLIGTVIRAEKYKKSLKYNCSIYPSVLPSVYDLAIVGWQMFSSILKSRCLTFYATRKVTRIDLSQNLTIVILLYHHKFILAVT